jgi:uncharacterized membrane protein
MDGSSFGRAFDGLATAFMVSLCLVPLGLWKLVEIVIWVCQHVHFE